jgi:uncharacterized protein (TIGR03086 family)
VDVVEALLTALEAQWGLGAKAIVPDLSRPSRCPGWSVADVMNHSIGVTRKFAEFASGATDRPHAPAGDLIGDRLDLALRTTTDIARAAWSSTDRSRHCHLPFGTFPAGVAAGINLVDVLAHGWDVGCLGGSVFTCPDEVWSLGLGMAREYLGTQRASRPFDPEIAIATDASPERCFLAYVGRA